MVRPSRLWRCFPSSLPAFRQSYPGIFAALVWSPGTSGISGTASGSPSPRRFPGSLRSSRRLSSGSRQERAGSLMESSVPERAGGGKRRSARKAARPGKRRSARKAARPRTRPGTATIPNQSSRALIVLQTCLASFSAASKQCVKHCSRSPRCAHVCASGIPSRNHEKEGESKCASKEKEQLRLAPRCLVFYFPGRCIGRIGRDKMQSSVHRS